MPHATVPPFKKIAHALPEKEEILAGIARGHFYRLANF